MSVAGTRGPRGNGRPGFADPVEAVAIGGGDSGFGLHVQRTAQQYVPLPMVNASAVVGAMLVDLLVVAGGIPVLGVPPRHDVRRRRRCVNVDARAAARWLGRLPRGRVQQH